jgi:uncharacterized protein YacL
MEKFFEQLAIITEKLGFTAERVWPQIVQITFVQSLTELVIGLVFFVLSLFVFRELVKLSIRKVREAVNDEHDHYIAFAVLSGVVVALLGVLFLTQLPSNISGVLFPEAMTILEMLKSVK